MIENLQKLIHVETTKAVRAILESNLSSGDGEKERQRRQSDSVNKRNLSSSDNPERKEEAEEEAEDKKPDVKKSEVEPKKREDRSKGKGTADSPKLRDPKKEQLKNPPVTAVIDKLNALRGGRSLKDPDVKKSFTQYYEGLTTPEKQSLIVFLTGIAQVLAGSEEGAEAIDPGDVGLRVKPTSGDSKKDTRPDTDEKSKEGTTDNPIVVGELASKYNIMKALKEYKKYSK